LDLIVGLFVNLHKQVRHLISLNYISSLLRKITMREVKRLYLRIKRNKSSSDRKNFGEFTIVTPYGLQDWGFTGTREMMDRVMDTGSKHTDPR
ncbi:hypothetical protein ACJX0J_037242, partial [Zea mays]